jgi:ABC-type multidrug transport system fused ATPase/permease subunit
MNLFLIIRQSRKAILFVLSLVVIEYVAWIVEPTLFGNVIDVFIDKELPHTSAGFIIPIVLWSGIFLINSGTGAFRRSIEPKIYMPLFSKMAMSVAKEGFRKKHSVSKTAGRSELVREYIHFFQYHVPEIIDQSISIGGAVIALTFFDYRIAIACLTIVGPLMIITKRYARKIEEEQHSLHNIREETFDVFSAGDLNRIEEYYRNMTVSEKKIAHWGGMNFGIVRIFLLLIFLSVLFIAIDIDEFTTGNIYSIVAYLWTFVTSTEYLPELLESLTSLRELNQRLRVGDKKEMNADLPVD